MHGGDSKRIANKQEAAHIKNQALFEWGTFTFVTGNTSCSCICGLCYSLSKGKYSYVYTVYLRSIYYTITYMHTHTHRHIYDISYLNSRTYLHENEWNGPSTIWICTKRAIHTTWYIMYCYITSLCNMWKKIIDKALSKMSLCAYNAFIYYIIYLDYIQMQCILLFRLNVSV